jgi:putative addiction module killer protein
MYEVRQYIDGDGTNLFSTWFERLRDPKAKVAVLRRTNRLVDGNFGDHKSLGSGVWELRLDTGPGYRVYYAKAGKVVILLLCGGNKASQDRDIETAKDAWKDWQARQREDHADND